MKVQLALAGAFAAGVLTLALSAGPAAAQSCDQHNRTIAVINGGASTITYVQATNSTRSDWGDDLLGESTVIASGNYVAVNPEDCSGQCSFDFLVTYEGGQQVETYGVNVCQASQLACTEASCSWQ